MQKKLSHFLKLNNKIKIFDFIDKKILQIIKILINI
jgi:hypothetical protein